MYVSPTAWLSTSVGKVMGPCGKQTVFKESSQKQGDDHVGSHIINPSEHTSDARDRNWQSQRRSGSCLRLQFQLQEISDLRSKI
ncbi:hypothetical protein MUK42_21503 [Musa troglodytarum]|uniref:Uncharacterized protein n=1 Tax=Musa troglodytarum TaxID=320322 RepID=A0A9E7K483_9LILI|nr:hypothetical protein MUK42_21503 [Musa troglodytarum]